VLVWRYINSYFDVEKYLINHQQIQTRTATSSPQSSFHLFNSYYYSTSITPTHIPTITMKSFTAAAIISLIAAVSALPAAQTTPHGPTTEVTLCTDQDYQGTCTTETAILDVCHQLSAPYYHNLGSMKVASGALCRLT
jgi:hypothetical protein